MKRFVIAILILTLCVTVYAIKSSLDQWARFSDFSGGMNQAVNRSQLSENEIWDSWNFIWKDGQLRVRDGFYRFAAPMSNSRGLFVDIFKPRSGTAYLMYSDGSHLWYRQDLTDTSLALNFGRSNRSCANVYAGKTIVDIDTPTVAKLRTIHGTGEGLTVTIGDSSRIVSYILLDTLLYTTVAWEDAQSAAAYNIDISQIEIADALVNNDQYWVYANVGKFYYYPPDSIVVADSLTGTRYQETSPYNIMSSKDGKPFIRFTSTSIYGDNYSGKFLRLTTNPVAHESCSVPAGHTMYTSYPIYQSGTPYGNLYCAASAGRPSATAQYFVIENLVYDTTTQVEVTLDSMTMEVLDSATYSVNGNEPTYFKCYKSSWTDSMQYATGDWFMSPVSLARLGTYNGYVTKQSDMRTWMYNFPVVGGYLSSDKNIIVLNGFYSPGSRSDYAMTDHDTCKVYFFRMKRSGTTQDTLNYRFGVQFQDRVFSCTEDNPTQLSWSEPFLPDSSISTSVMTLEKGDGDKLQCAATQSGDLIVYGSNNRWKVFGDGTNAGYGRELLNGSVGCVAPRSLLNIDNTHYWLHSTGFYRSAGDVPELLSAKVNDFFLDTLNTAEYAKVASGYDKDNDNIWVSFPRVGATDNNVTLVFNIPSGSWWRQSFAAGAYCFNADKEISDSVRFIALGTDSSTIYVAGRAKDDGDSLEAFVQTAWLDFDQPETAKRIQEFLFGINSPQANTSRIISWRDFSTTAFDTLSVTNTATWNQQRLWTPSGDYRGNNLAHELKIYNASGVTIPYWNIKVRLLGEEE